MTDDMWNYLPRLMGQLLIPLIIISLIASKSKKGSKRDVIIISSMTIVLAIMWSAGLSIVAGAGCIVIGSIAIISIYTRKELPAKDKPKN